MKNMLSYFPNLKKVLISTNLMDFSDLQRNISVNYGRISFFLDREFGSLIKYIPFNLKYLYNNAKKNRVRHFSKNTYQSLKFDKNGGVILDIDTDSIREDRWNKEITQYEISNEEVEHLKSLSELLNSKNIDLIVSFSPIRNGMLDDHKRNEILQKINNIRHALNGTSIKMIEPYTNNTWPDSLFVDFAHLNNMGTIKYTNYILKKIK